MNFLIQIDFSDTFQLCKRKCWTFRPAINWVSIVLIWQWPKLFRVQVPVAFKAPSKSTMVQDSSYLAWCQSNWHALPRRHHMQLGLLSTSPPLRTPAWAVGLGQTIYVNFVSYHHSVISYYNCMLAFAETKKHIYIEIGFEFRTSWNVPCLQ